MKQKPYGFYEAARCAVKRSAREVLREPKARFIGRSPASRVASQLASCTAGALHFQTKEHCSRSALLFGGAFSLRLGHRLALTVHRTVIHYQMAAHSARYPSSDRRLRRPVRRRCLQKTAPRLGCCILEAPPGFGPGHKGFADPCLTTWLWRRVYRTAHDLRRATCTLAEKQ